MSQLPRLYLDLVEDLGEAVAARLVAVRGGCELYIPTDHRPDHPLIQAMGEHAATLVEVRGGERISVPSCRAAQRRAIIRRLYDGGASMSEIALTVGLNQRHVRRMLSEMGRGDARQLDLFSPPSDD